MKAAAHPAVELLGRYRAVFGAAWSMRRELAGPTRLAGEAAFLPAALALQETPPHPAPRRAAWLIMGAFAFTIAWACIGQVDVVAVAPGRIVVADGSKVVQPLETSVVKAIHVANGDRVRAGQVLVELDPAAAQADTESLQAQRLSAREELQRTTALLAAMRTGTALGPATDAAQRAEWSDITSRLARLDAEAAHRQAELVTAREAVGKLEQTLPMAQRREAELNQLAAQGFVSAHMGQDRTRERVEQERDLATLRARLAETKAALEESRQTRRSFVAETERTLQDRQTRARQDLRQLEPQEAKQRHRERLTRLVAPISGQVQQLAVHSTGGVVTAAQVLMVVVPENADVIAEVAIDNKDIGFVKEGQEAQLKLEAFDFTRYGVVPATVLRVGRDAVLDDKRGPVFPATLKVGKPPELEGGERIWLGPGMAVSGEIRLERRAVMGILLRPVIRVVASSGRER